MARRPFVSPQGYCNTLHTVSRACGTCTKRNFFSQRETKIWGLKLCLLLIFFKFITIIWNIKINILFINFFLNLLTHRCFNQTTNLRPCFMPRRNQLLFPQQWRATIVEGIKLQGHQELKGHAVPCPRFLPTDFGALTLNESKSAQLLQGRGGGNPISADFSRLEVFWWF